jgi:hypothetical protein
VAETTPNPSPNPDPMHLNPNGMPWERLPNETEKAFEAFGYYLRLPRPRSVADAFFAFKGIERPPNTDCPGGWRAWARQHKWILRVDIYDAAKHFPAVSQFTVKEIAQKVDGTRERVLSAGEHQRRKQIADMAQKTAGMTLTDSELDWAEERRTARADDLDLARKVLNKAREMLEVALIRRRVIPADPKNGKPEIHIFEPVKWSFKTMAEMITAAVQIRRLAVELPTKVADDTANQTGNDDALFAATIGQLEAALPAGIVPPMPVDVTRRPEPMRPPSVTGADLTRPGRMRPG